MIITTIANTRTPQPATVRVLRQLVAEAKAAGLEHLPVSAIEAALNRIENQ